MKTTPVLIAIGLSLLFTMTIAGAAPRLIIMSGQSNMVKLNVEEYFTPLVEEALSGDEIVVVKEAEGGQPIRRWYRDWKPWQGISKDEAGPIGDLYDSLMVSVKPHLNPETPYASVTLVWMQGERDAKPIENSQAYGENLKGLIDQFRADLGRPDLMVVVGRINQFGIDDPKRPGWETVRQAQVSVAENDPLTEWVNLDDLGKGLHYDREGYEKMGERFAETAAKLIRESAASTGQTR